MRRIVLVALVLVGGVVGIVPANADEIEIYGYGPGIEEAFAFSMRHISDANEGPDAHDSSALPPPVPGNPSYIEISSSPYDVILFQDSRNQSSTLPVEISAILRNADNIDIALYFDIRSGYEHRNLTIQEVDPCNPNDPNNPNPIQDIRSLPIEYDMYKYDVGSFQQDVVRMFRVGVYRILDGDLTENGAVDFNDFAVFGNYWLDETAEAENLNISDIDHDRLTDELDLFYFVDTWLKEE